MRFAIFLLVLLCPAITLAGKSDSLRTVIHDAQRPDSVRLKAFRSFIWKGYLFSDLDSARLLIDSMYRMAARMHVKAAAGDACSMRGITYMLVNDYPSSIIELRRAEALFKEAGSSDGVAAVQNNMGNAYWKMGDLSQAVELYRLSLVHAEAKQDSGAIVSGENNVGLIYKDLNDTLRAKEHWERALRISEMTENASGIAMACLNLSTVTRPGSDSLMVVYLRRAAAGFAQVGNAMYQGTALGSLGQILTRSGRTVEARRMIDSAMAVLRPMGEEMLIRPRVLLLELYVKEERYSQVISDGEALRPLVDSAATLRDAMDLYNLLEDAYVATGNLARAYVHQKRFHQLKDSLWNEDNKRGLVRSEYRYAYEQQVFADSLEHAAEVMEATLRNEQKLTTERARRNLALALGGSLAVLVAGVWQRGRLLRRSNKAILEAQTKLVESERAREASEVRTRIARDVHDQLGSDLTKLSMLGSEVSASLKDDPAAVPDLVADIDRIASEAGRSLSDIVWAVEPAHDTLTGLMDRSRQFCERMLKDSGATYTIDCVVEGRDRPLEPATKRDLYLILREAVNNTVKYAEAHCIHVTFVARESSVRLEVKDDGKGFNTISAMRKGRGLRNLKERAERLGGRLVIASEPEGGTLVRLEVELVA